MPIVGPTATGATATLGCTTYISTLGGDNNDWSHSTVFVTLLPTLAIVESLNVPPLTTIYTPPNECIDRWMVGPECNDGITVYSIDPSKSIVSDARYNSCQLYRRPTYSPGICPSGHIIAEVTAYEGAASSGFRTFWQASCCRSGMTFGPEYPSACVSNFSTLLRAHGRITTSPEFSGATVTPVYEYTSWSNPTIAGGSGTSSVISSITTITAGLAVADPVVVAWQLEDFSLFPSEYATSLAGKIGIDLPASTPTSNLPPPMTPPESNGLSTGAKAGIGIGVALGVASIAIALIVLYLRRRRKVAANVHDTNIPEMEDQDQHLRQHKWFSGGRWRSEVQAEAAQQELDSKTVRVVPGPPAELEASEPQPGTYNRDMMGAESVIHDDDENTRSH